MIYIIFLTTFQHHFATKEWLITKRNRRRKGYRNDFLRRAWARVLVFNVWQGWQGRWKQVTYSHGVLPPRHNLCHASFPAGEPLPPLHFKLPQSRLGAKYVLGGHFSSQTKLPVFLPLNTFNESNDEILG